MITLANEFQMGSPICTHATCDIAFEMAGYDSVMGNLFYFYVEVVCSQEEFAADPVHSRALPNNIPQVPLPASLSPDGSDNYMLLRSVTPA